MKKLFFSLAACLVFALACSPKTGSKSSKTTDPQPVTTLPEIDLPNLDIPIIAINGEYDRPNARTHRLAREAKAFTNLVLPGKGHLSAMMAGFIPQAYIDGYAAFIVANNPN